MGNFNIRDSLWDPTFPHHSSHSDTLFEIADSFQIDLSRSVVFSPIRFTDNAQDLNSVLDLVFLHPNSQEFDNHHIHPNWRLTSDHAPISVDISIIDEQLQTKKCSLIKNSDEEYSFIKEIISFLKNINTHSISSIENLESVVQKITFNINNIWFKNSKNINIMKHFKAW